MNYTLIDTSIIKISMLHMVLVIINIMIIIKNRKFSTRQVVILIILVTMPLVKLFELEDCIEFLKTYFMYILIVFTYLFFIPYLNRHGKDYYPKFCSYLIIFIFCTQVFGITQWLVANFLGSLNLYDIFGSRQFHGAQLIGEFKGFIRADSIYPEPSILALVSNLSLALVWMNHFIKYKRLLIVVNIISIIISFSSLGFIILLSLILVKLFLDKRWIFLFMVGATAFLATLLTDIMSVFRFHEILIPSTSGYYRVVTPFLLLNEVLTNNFFLGIGLGQIDIVVPQYDFMVLGEGVGKTIDNNFTVIIVSFGVLGLIMIALLLKKYIKYCARNKMNLIIFIYLLGFCISNGLFFSPEFILFIIIIEWTMHYKCVEE
ncbi:hypothetical protein [Bacillus mobilis]